MTSEPARILREKRTIGAMIDIYCRRHHGTSGEPCGDCSELLDYATGRLDKCPFAAEKPTCADCPVHCYKPAMREKAREVMRYAGPRLIFRHPVLALLHVVDGLRSPKQT